MDGAARKQRTLELTQRYAAPHRVEVWEAFGTQLVIGRREGYKLWDLTGHELVDMHLNGGTFNLGHRNPEVIDELVRALDEVDIGNHHFASEARAELAETLAGLTPGALRYSVFASGGSEAVDVAIKSARQATGRRRLVTLSAGYHGRTGLSGAAGDDTGARYFLSDRPDEFVKVPFGDLDAVTEALSGGDIAAVLIETIPATYGFPLPPEGYLAGIKRRCEEAGALFIADEVQTGLGRTGPLWAIEAHGVDPDILVTGKGLSGGIYPIATSVMTPHAGGWLLKSGWGHVSTFGGSELGCRVAGRVLEITTRPEVRENTAALTAQFEAGLTAIAEREPFVTEIRQAGLVIGLRVAHPNGAVYLQQELYELGVWAIASGFDQSVLQLKPGLLLDETTAAFVLEQIDEAVRRAKDIDRPVPRRHRSAT